MLDFSQIKIGDQTSFELQVTEEQVNTFARLVGDFNPLHLDEGYAKKSLFGQRICHGMLLSSFFSKLVGMYLPGENALYLGQEARFIKPVFIGDHVRICGTVAAKSESSRLLKLKTQIFNSGNECVVEGEANVMVRGDGALSEGSAKPAGGWSASGGEAIHAASEPKQSKIASSAPSHFSKDLSNLCVLITGSSRGIGARAAIALAGQRARTAINYRSDEAGAEEVEKEIRSAGGEVLKCRADITNSSQVLEMIRRVKEKWGPIQLLVNNASPPALPKEFTKSTWEDFEKQLDGNVKGAYYCIQEVLPDMLAQKKGNIINILTTYALSVPPVGLSSYVTAKSALMGLSRSLAAELGPHGIRVNMIAPGMTETSFTAHVPQRMKDLFAFQTPLRRLASAEDIANLILFLASDESKFITGAIIPVCGGAVMP